MNTAWMFPGQGSQVPGMGRELIERYDSARETLAMAEMLSGLPLDRLRRRGPIDDLRVPSVAEPLITAISIGYVDALRMHGFEPDCLAGYSAGEVAAYYAAGVLTRENALRIAVLRGQMFEEYTSYDSRMSSIQGIARDEVETVVAHLTRESWNISIAAYNAEEHTTIVGDSSSVFHAEGLFSRMGGEVSLVNVAGKWHSPHLDEAADRLLIQLSKFPFSKPKIPISTSVSGKRRDEPIYLIQDLAMGVARPVYWHSIVQRWKDQGIQRFVECGAGRVLFSLMRWNMSEHDDYDAVCVEDRGGGLRPLQRLVREATSDAGSDS